MRYCCGRSRTEIPTGSCWSASTGVAKWDGAYGQTFLEWRDQAKVFEQIAAYTSDTADLTGSGEPERLTAGMVSADLFATLGVAPALGRAFTPEEDTDGGAPVVILSDGLWRRRFGGDPQVIGRALTLGGQSRTVVGIMPPGFRFPEESDLWLPLAINVRANSVRSIHRECDRASQGRRDAGSRQGRFVCHPRADSGKRFPETYSDVRVRVIRLERAARRQCATGLAGTVRSGRLCPAHRLRQRGEPAAGAGGGQTKGDGDPRGDWRGAAAARATVADREFAALAAGRRGRAARGEVGRQAARGDESRRDRAHQGEQTWMAACSASPAW